MPTNHTIDLTRQQLLDLVWSKPAIHLARELGVSDSGLAKICRRHHVPRPPSGYFLMREDRRREPPELPEISDPQLEIIRFFPRERAPLASAPAEIQVMLEAELRRERPVRVSARLTQPHPLVELTRKYLEKEKPSHDSPLICGGERHLDVHVAPKSVPRAMRILDALIKAAEARGFSVAVQAEAWGGRPKTFMTIAGERIPFRLVEKLTQHVRSLTPAEEEARAAGRQTHFYGRYSYSASGRLWVVIDKDSHASTIRKRWKDTTQQRLEDGLDGFFVAALRFVAGEKIDQARKAEEAMAYRRWAEKRAERQRELEEERARVKELLEQVDAWHLAGRIREYVWAVQVRSGAIDRWRTWALAQADRIDPRVPSPPSILDEAED